MTYISSTSLSSPLRQAVLQAQASLAQAQTEVTTGVQADLGAALGARAGTVVSLQNQADALAGYQNANALVSTRLDTTAATLTNLITGAQSMSKSLIAAGSTGLSAAGLGTSADAALQALLAGLNTTVDGQHIFGGINTGVQPMSGYAAGSGAKTAVDAAFQQAFGVSQTDNGASAVGGADMTRFLDGPFDALFDPTGWSSTWSQASDQAMTTAVAPGQTATTSVSANAAGFRQIAEAYTMVREFTGSTMSADAKAAVVAKATTLMNAGIAALTQTQAGVGTAQSTIEAADTTLSAQATLLKGKAFSLESVDPYALSAQVSTLQTQLQASYQLTAQLQKLSLVNYISG